MVTDWNWFLSYIYLYTLQELPTVYDLLYITNNNKDIIIVKLKTY